MDKREEDSSFYPRLQNQLVDGNQEEELTEERK
jgi:hypothetical protein